MKIKVSKKKKMELGEIKLVKKQQTGDRRQPDDHPHSGSRLKDDGGVRENGDGLALDFGEQNPSDFRDSMSSSFRIFGE